MDNILRKNEDGHPDFMQSTERLTGNRTRNVGNRCYPEWQQVFPRWAHSMPRGTAVGRGPGTESARGGAETYQRCEKQELEKQTMQSELRFLKSQINPHFLFNTLNNLYALTLKKSDKAPEIVIKLSEMMRYMLYECNEKRVMLSKEVNYIKNYIDLESLRQGKNVKINFQLIGDAGHRMIAPLMFTPFLENSFKHGVGNLIANGFVNIKLSVNGDDVDFYIENSKPDKPPTSIHKDKRSGGIGLVNVQKRLNLLYPEKYDLQIKDTPNAYAVHLKINLDE